MLRLFPHIWMTMNSWWKWGDYMKDKGAGATQELKPGNMKKESRILEEIEELEKEIKEKEEKAGEYLEMLQRLQAEFENYKKRVKREQVEYCEQANTQLVLKLLPVLDNFERALTCETEGDSFKKGMEIIFSQFMSILDAEGLSGIEALGTEFDPYYHECVLTEKGDYEEDAIIEEFEKGYLFKDKVIRPSKVKVGKRGD
jgi:molecular chaperone GrpE